MTGRSFRPRTRRTVEMLRRCTVDTSQRYSGNCGPRKETTMAKRTTVALVIAGAAALIATTAVAAPPPKFGCSTGDDLMTVTQINNTITTPGYEQVVIDFDQAGNADGLLCVHILPDPAGKKTSYDPYFVVRDNVKNPNTTEISIPRSRPGGHG